MDARKDEEMSHKNLWTHLKHEHGLTLLESELQEIRLCVLKDMISDMTEEEFKQAGNSIVHNWTYLYSDKAFMCGWNQCVRYFFERMKK